MEPDTSLVLAPGAGTPEYDRGSIFFVGTATVILRYAGFVILTDPNFLHAANTSTSATGSRPSASPNRPWSFDDLPPLDFVLVSHLHEDHFDRLVERELPRTLPIVTTRHGAQRARREGFRARARARDLGDGRDREG